MTANEIISIIIASGSLLVVIIMALRQSRRESTEDAEELEKRLVLLEVRLDLLWDLFRKRAAAELHSPDPEHARTDYLIERYDADELSDAELGEFVAILEGIIKDPNRSMVDVKNAETVLQAIKHKYFIAKAVGSFSREGSLRRFQILDRFAQDLRRRGNQ